MPLGLLRWSNLSLTHLALEEMTGLQLVVTHVMHVCGLRLCVWPVLHPVRLKQCQTQNAESYNRGLKE